MARKDKPQKPDFKAEEKTIGFNLCTSLAILQSVVDSLKVAIYVMDRNLTIQWTNNRASRWLQTKDVFPLSGKQCYKEIHGNEKPCADCPVLNTFNSGRTELCVYKSERNGEPRYYLLTASPLRAAQDEDLDYVVEMVQDVTDQTRAAEKMKRLSDFNSAIIENAPVAIFTLDRNGTFTSVNPALAKLSGLGIEAQKKLIGFNWLDGLHAIKSGLARYIKKGLKGEPFELHDFPYTSFWVNRPHFIDFKGVPLKGDGGETEGLLCIIEEVTERVKEKKSLKEKNILLEEHLHRVDVPDSFIGESEPIRKVKELISVVAASNAPVLVLGETGVGKELVARAVHKQSGRSANPFVVINSSALQETMVESELFGFKKGAFTSANSDKQGLLKIANTGTFFMDEVGVLNSAIQAKFLRVLETGAFRRLGETQETTVDVRFIFATNKVLEEEVKERRFRKDLFYRLNGFTIVVPPLRERKEDIPLLVDYFLRKQARGGCKKTVSKEVMELLMEYRWPGNVRELANLMERMVLLSGSRDEIMVNDFPHMAHVTTADGSSLYARPNAKDMADLSKVQRQYIEEVLKTVGGNKSRAARILGISRRKLYRTIEE
jgi:PAS domain S-box-containing protein